MTISKHETKVTNLISENRDDNGFDTRTKCFEAISLLYAVFVEGQITSQNNVRDFCDFEIT